MTAAPTIGQEVVRSLGGYPIGNVGNVIAIDLEKGRAQVDWNKLPKSWVSFSALEPTSIPYTITEGYFKDKSYTNYINPKYNRV